MNKSKLPQNGSPLDDDMLRILDSNSVMSDAAWGLPENTSPLTRMTNIELHYRLPELLLMRVDKMTMAHSIEARVPFLDHRVVQAVFDLPVDWKLKNGLTKSLLKDAVQGLIPGDVIKRPKIGFGAPVSHWLKGKLGTVVEKEIKNSKLFLGGWFDMAYIQKMFDSHRAGEGDYGPNLWTLYNLSLWHNMWIEEDLI
jgi:asparagine synthase (glutamine-hydrolysing)